VPAHLRQIHSPLGASAETPFNFQLPVHYLTLSSKNKSDAANDVSCASSTRRKGFVELAQETLLAGSNLFHEDNVKFAAFFSQDAKNFAKKTMLPDIWMEQLSMVGHSLLVSTQNFLFISANKQLCAYLHLS